MDGALITTKSLFSKKSMATGFLSTDRSFLKLTSAPPLKLEETTRAHAEAVKNINSAVAETADYAGQFNP